MAFATDGDDRAGRAQPMQHPDLARVASEMRAEWRAEQEAATADAVAQWRHARTLADWLRDRMHAGDLVGVCVLGQRFTGRVEEVGADLVALRGSRGRVEVHVADTVPVAFEFVEHATSGGTRGGERRGFRDALVARDGQEDLAIAALQLPAGIRGTLLVGRDFVTVVAASGAETVVPIAQVAWVAPAGRDGSPAGL